MERIFWPSQCRNGSRHDATLVRRWLSDVWRLDHLWDDEPRRRTASPAASLSAATASNAATTILCSAVTSSWDGLLRQQLPL